MHIAAKLLAPPLVVLVLAGGLWFWGGVVAPGYWSTIALAILWFVACSVILGRLAQARPELRRPVRATFLTCCVVAASGFYWTSLRDTVVDERVVTGIPASKVAVRVAGDPLAPQPTKPIRDAPRPQANVTDHGCGSDLAAERSRVAGAASP